MNKQQYEHMIITPEVIARYVHPEDPRVIVTPVRKIFMAAAKDHDQYRAVILQRSAALKARLSERFQTVAETLKSEFCILDARAQDGDITINTPNSNDFEFYELVQSELLSMARLYNRLTGTHQMTMSVLRRLFTRTMHPHDFPVLNCNWLTDGTAWKNPSGKLLHAERGDLLFMKPNFYHTASFDPNSITEEHRLLIALMPTEYSH